MGERYVLTQEQRKKMFIGERVFIFQNDPNCREKHMYTPAINKRVLIMPDPQITSFTQF